MTSLVRRPDRRVEEPLAHVLGLAMPRAVDSPAFQRCCTISEGPAFRQAVMDKCGIANATTSRDDREAVDNFPGVV